MRNIEIKEKQTANTNSFKIIENIIVRTIIEPVKDLVNKFDIFFILID